jgi:hypothetical protein
MCYYPPDIPNVSEFLAKYDTIYTEPESDEEPEDDTPKEVNQFTLSLFYFYFLILILVFFFLSFFLSLLKKFLWDHDEDMLNFMGRTLAYTKDEDNKRQLKDNLVEIADGNYKARKLTIRRAIKYLEATGAKDLPDLTTILEEDHPGWYENEHENVCCREGKKREKRGMVANVFCNRTVIWISWTK